MKFAELLHVKKAMLIAFVGVVGIDQLTKCWARGVGSVVINEGVSFGLGSRGEAWMFSLVSVGVLVFLFFHLREIWRENWWVLGLLSGAAVSNVIDRWWWGGVLDFLSVPVISVRNNLADWVIFGCMVWVCMRLLQRRRV
jgi:lipoprotein signal peptidase